MQAIVLCGGLGSRLGELTRDMPKPLLEVAGRPFLHYVLDRLGASGVTGIILAVSYQRDKIMQAIGERWGDLPVRYSVEQEALGTGGAIAQAMHQEGLEQAMVLNGDTLLDMDLDTLLAFHAGHDGEVSMVLKKIDDTARFGRVVLDEQGRVRSFEEKGAGHAGLINAGIYCVRRAALSAVTQRQFSFERDILMAQLPRLAIHGLPVDAYFIDMGVPEDFARAQVDLRQRHDAPAKA